MSSNALSREQCRAIFGRVQKAARGYGVRDVEAHLGCRAEALTRFANNAIHQNVAEQTRWLSVRTLLDGRTARASTNRFDDDSILRVVEQAVALTRSVAPDPDMLPLAEPNGGKPVARFHTCTSHTTPGQRAGGVAEAIHIVESLGQTAAGIFSTEHSTEGLFNSAGVGCWHNETMARFSITAMTGDSSGWAKASSTERSRISAADLAHSAAEKARLSRDPRELPPGHYTVILEPAAVLDLVGQMFADFSATAISDKRSFLTDRLGKPLFGPNINIYDDAWHPMQNGAPFDGEGVTRKPLTLVEQGVPREVAWSRISARKAGVEPTGHGLPLPNQTGEMPHQIVISGGDTALPDMIASTARGILVTRLWYIREVDPYEKIMTGMTRDGTFLIEDGQVVCGVRNFRFNQSIISLLCNVESMSPATRASGEEIFDMVVPAMKVRDFHFSEVTRF